MSSNGFNVSITLVYHHPNLPNHPGIFSGSHAGHQNVDLNRLPAISPVEMGLLGVNKELQFGVYNCGEPHAQIPPQQERTFFKKGKRKVGAYSKQRVCWRTLKSFKYRGFFQGLSCRVSLAELLPGKESFSSVGLCYCHSA